MNNRVRIGTCAGPADAALVRSAFAAHDLPVQIGHENFANVLGGLGGSFVSLDIFVAEEDAEEAAALLADLRAGDHAADAGSELDPRPDADEDADAEGVWQSAREAGVSLELDVPEEAVVLSSDRRRRTAISLLLAFCITFGTAHMYTRAWFRGILLAGLEILGFTHVASGSKLGVPLVMGAVLFDAFGAVWRSWVRPPALPPARVRT